MSAIRDAAQKIRVDTKVAYERGHIGARDLHWRTSLAEWLDTAGADLWAHGPLCICHDGCDECDDELWQPHVRRALAVARAYLGERP